MKTTKRQLIEFVRDLVNEPWRMKGDELEKTLYEARDLIARS